MARDYSKYSFNGVGNYSIQNNEKNIDNGFSLSFDLMTKPQILANHY